MRPGSKLKVLRKLTYGAAAAALTLASCMPVAPYQRAMLNGEDMELAAPTVLTFEGNVEAYREGASGANGGKIGGGCGCN